MNTIMAGLACGEPSTIGWNILRTASYRRNFVRLFLRIRNKAYYERNQQECRGGENRMLTKGSGKPQYHFIVENRIIGLKAAAVILLVRLK